MKNLIKNELIKIFKRSHIYLFIAIIIIYIVGFNLYAKYCNNDIIYSKNITKVYENSYTNDKMKLENYNIDESIIKKEKYDTLKERIKLEEYAIDNKIEYNILQGTDDKEKKIPDDARSLFIKTFNSFDIIIGMIIIFIASTILTEEFNKGTIKTLLTKPLVRTKVIISKILACTIITMFILFITISFQYLIGGITFGFDSYNLEAIYYNNSADNVMTMNLNKYMLLMLVGKLPLLMFIILIAMTIGTITKNSPMAIILSLTIYLISIRSEIYEELLSTFKISRYILPYDFNISLFAIGKNISGTILSETIIKIIAYIMVILTILILKFKKEEIKNN